MNASALEKLREELAKFPRMHGYYLLKTVPLPANWADDEEPALTCAFETLDDHPWKPIEERPKDQLWTDYEATESVARTHVIAALVGGREIGHTRDTIPELRADQIWRTFRALFTSSARFFLGVGLGNQAYVFLQGVVVADTTTAACLCVIESD